MGKRNRERIARINAGLEYPRSITHPTTSKDIWRYVPPKRTLGGLLLNHNKQRLEKLSNKKVISSSM
jgi:hypothetical protein